VASARRDLVTSPSPLERLRREDRLAPWARPTADPGLLDALGAGGDAASRRVYARAPFDHAPPAADPLAFERGLSPLAREVGARLPRTGLVLEIGSGPGHVTTWLRRAGVPVVALDQSRESLERLRQRTDAVAVVGDARRLPFGDAAFDAVLADGVLHHTARPRRAFEEAVRVLRPGGLLFVRVYRAEATYPTLYRMIGGMLRALDRDDLTRPLLDRVAAPLYERAALARDRRRGGPVGVHDRGVFSDYFLTPHATPVRGGAFLAWVRGAGLEPLAYEAFGNVHGFLARRRAGVTSP
jgi:SAM-dependent methyltransferase